MTEHIAILVEHDGKKIKPAAWELFAFAEHLAKLNHAAIHFIMIGEATRNLAQQLSTQTQCRVIAADVKSADTYHGQIYTDAFTQLLSQHPATYIIASHSTSGMDMIPALSIALNGTCITGIENTDTDDDQTLYFTRAVSGGKILARLCAPLASASAPLCLTVSPGAFKPVIPDKNAAPDIIHTAVECEQTAMIYKKRLASPSLGSNLTKAEVIVSGGRGIQEEENYALIKALADLFPRSAAGASRPICDYGWAEYSQQVGATGTIVSPKLYIACGISGATQHLEGIRDARFIVAINKDSNAPIMQIADVCIVEDLTEFIPLFMETFKKRKRPVN